MCCGVSYDGESTMSHELSRLLQRKIMEAVPNALFAHYCPHNVNLNLSGVVSSNIQTTLFFLATLRQVTSSFSRYTKGRPTHNF